MTARPTLVALRALWLGDFLTAVPALRALDDAFAGHRRVLAAPASMAPLAELADLGFDVVDGAPLMPLDETLGNAHTAVNLHGRGPESHRVLLAARPTRLIAFRHEDVEESKGMPEWREGEHEAARWCRLLEESGIAADVARLRLRAPVARIPEWEGATVVHPGAKAAERRWPAWRWASVARAEARTGRRVLITGSAAELPLARTVACRAGLARSSVLAGVTSIGALATLVARAGRVVSGDTGVAHLATALGTPSVTLFGPVAPAEWGPSVDPEIHRAIWKPVSGTPARPGSPGAPHRALAAVSVADVLGELGRLP